MQNITVTLEENIATIRFDITKDFGLSKGGTGKNLIVASSSGFQTIGNGSSVKFNLTVIKKPKDNGE